MMFKSNLNQALCEIPHQIVESIITKISLMACIFEMLSSDEQANKTMSCFLLPLSNLILNQVLASNRRFNYQYYCQK